MPKHTHKTQTFKCWLEDSSFISGCHVAIVQFTQNQILNEMLRSVRARFVDGIFHILTACYMLLFAQSIE